jgi:hypothetical protein
MNHAKKMGFVETGRERIKILKPHDLVRIADGLEK